MPAAVLDTGDKPGETGTFFCRTDDKMSDRVVLTPEDEARMAFDAEHNVEPCRTIAERIAWQYGANRNHPLVDKISSAIEDARVLGEQRARSEVDLWKSRYEAAEQALDTTIKDFNKFVSDGP